MIRRHVASALVLFAAAAQAEEALPPPPLPGQIGPAPESTPARAAQPQMEVKSTTVVEEESGPNGSGAALGPHGHEGAFQTVSPWLRGKGKLQVGAGGGFYQGTGLLKTNVRDQVAEGSAFLSYGVADWLSLSASFAGRSVDNAATVANVMAVGNLSLGAVAAGRFGPFAGGAFVDVLSLAQIGQFGSAGPGVMAGLMGSAEVAGSGTTPLRLTLQGAFIHDDASGYQHRAWDDVTRLGYDAYSYQRLAASLLVEWRTPYVAPLLEVRSHALLGAPPEGRQVPLYLSPALRVTPTDRLAIDLGCAIGFNAGLVPGAPATLPWLAHVGVSYALEPFKTVEVVREVVRHEAPKGTIEGAVLDDKTGEPLGQVVIALPSTRLTDLATRGRTGAFETPGLEPGLYPLVAQKDGYEPEQAIVTVRVGEPSRVEIRLKPQPPIGMIKGFIRDEKGNPLAATLLFPDAPQPVQPKESSGTFQVELAPGKYRVEARSVGYLVQGRTIELHQKETVLFDLVLREVPQNRVAVLQKSEIKVNQVIQFEFNKTRILPESYYILDEVVDILLQHPEIRLLEVAGHTDNVGGAESNLKLSQGRAQSVREYLLEKGIAAGRLIAAGYGLTRPIASNDTEEGRAKNRRVEFLFRTGADAPPSEPAAQPAAPAPAPAPAPATKAGRK